MNNIVKLNEATGNTLEEDLHYFVHNPTKPFRVQFMDEQNLNISVYKNDYIFAFNKLKARKIYDTRGLVFRNTEKLMVNIDCFGMGFPILSKGSKDSSYEDSWRHYFYRTKRGDKYIIAVAYNVRYLYDPKNPNNEMKTIIRIITMHIIQMKRAYNSYYAENRKDENNMAGFLNDKFVQKMEEIEKNEHWTWRPNSIPVTEDELLLLQEDTQNEEFNSDEERVILALERNFDRFIRTPYAYIVECFKDNEDYNYMYTIDSSKFTGEQLHNLSIFNEVNVRCFNLSIYRKFNRCGVLPRHALWIEHNMAMYAIIEGESQHMIRVKMMDAFGEDAILPPLTEEDLKTFKLPAFQKLNGCLHNE